MDIKPRGPRPTCPPISPQSYAKIKDEVAGLYPRERPHDLQRRPHSYRGGEALNLIHKDSDKGDIDRQSGLDVHVYPDANLLGQPCWRYESRKDDGFTVNIRGELDTPAGFSVDDITYDSAQERIVVQSYHQGLQEWELREFQLEGKGDELGRTPGQVIHRDQQPFESIEFDREGHLLAARDQQVLRCRQGRWEQVWQGQQPVQDLQTLSDGSLVLRVQSEGPTRYDLLYQPPEQEEFLLLPLPVRFQESVSPDGQKSVLFTESWPQVPLHARTSQHELGAIHDGSISPANTPFEEGYDLDSLAWSEDSRFLKVTSKPIDQAVADMRDTLVWDTQANKTYVLAGVQQLDFTPQGDLQLQALGQTQGLVLTPQELEQLPSQPWLQKLASMPVVIDSLPRWGARAYYRNGLEKTLIKSDNPRELGLSANGEFLIAIHPDHQAAEIFNLTNEVQAQIKDCHSITWVPEKKSLEIVSGEPPHRELYQGDHIGQSPWYKEALEKDLQDLVPPSSDNALVQQDPNGHKTYNGLKPPKKPQ